MWKFSNYRAGWQASIWGALCVWGMGEDACLQYCHCLGTYSSEQQANLILWNPGCHGRTQGEMSALAWVLIFFLMLVLNCLTQLAPGLLAYERDQLRWRIKGLTSSSINSFSPPSLSKFSCQLQLLWRAVSHWLRSVLCWLLSNW